MLKIIRTILMCFNYVLSKLSNKVVEKKLVSLIVVLKLVFAH